MKSIVQEQLAIRDLSHIYNEKDFLTYLNKIKRNYPGSNNGYFMALLIVDMFITNAPVEH
jgi:hypothetical protein